MCRERRGETLEAREQRKQGAKRRVSPETMDSRRDQSWAPASEGVSGRVGRARRDPPELDGASSSGSTKTRTARVGRGRGGGTAEARRRSSTRSTKAAERAEGVGSRDLVENADEMPLARWWWKMQAGSVFRMQMVRW